MLKIESSDFIMTMERAMSLSDDDALSNMSYAQIRLGEWSASSSNRFTPGDRAPELGYRMDDHRIGALFLPRARDLSLLHCIQMALVCIQPPIQ
jgi:hypothetical protein